MRNHTAKQEIISLKSLSLMIVGFFLTPFFAFAEALFDGGTLGTGAGSVTNFLSNILTFINVAIIPFLIGIGFLVFIWGMFQYFVYGGANDEAKAKGKSLMIYATLAFVLIIIFWGVVNLIAGSTGLRDPNDVSNMEQLTPKVNPLK